MSIVDSLLLAYGVGFVATYGLFLYRLIRPLPQMHPYLKAAPMPLIGIGLAVFALAWPITLIWVFLSKDPQEGGEDDSDSAP